MDYKLKAKQKEFLKMIVKPDCLYGVVCEIEAHAQMESAYHRVKNNADGNTNTRCWLVLHNIREKDLITGLFSVTVAFDSNDFCAVGPLKKNVWYERNKFDGNPNNYLVVEADCSEPNAFTRDVCVNSGLLNIYAVHSLSSSTTRFMYLDHPTKENTK